MKLKFFFLKLTNFSVIPEAIKKILKIFRVNDLRCTWDRSNKSTDFLYFYLTFLFLSLSLNIILFLPFFLFIFSLCLFLSFTLSFSLRLFSLFLCVNFHSTLLYVTFFILSLMYQNLRICKFSFKRMNFISGREKFVKNWNWHN